MYFNFVIVKIVNGVEYYTTYHITIHNTILDNNNQPVGNRLHLKYSEKNDGTIDSNDSLQEQPTMLLGFREMNFTFNPIEGLLLNEHNAPIRPISHNEWFYYVTMLAQHLLYTIANIN